MRVSIGFLVGMLVTLLFVAGCSSLIVREQDTLGETSAKVTARTVLALPTLGWSEVLIHHAALDEEAAATKAQHAIYFGAVCTGEGYAAGTEAHASCVAVKHAALPPAPSHVTVMGGPHSCYTSNGWTNCY